MWPANGIEYLRAYFAKQFVTQITPLLTKDEAVQSPRDYRSSRWKINLDTVNSNTTTNKFRIGSLRSVIRRSLWVLFCGVGRARYTNWLMSNLIFPSKDGVEISIHLPPTVQSHRLIDFLHEESRVYHFFTSFLSKGSWQWKFPLQLELACRII